MLIGLRIGLASIIWLRNVGLCMPMFPIPPIPPILLMSPPLGRGGYGKLLEVIGDEAQEPGPPGMDSAIRSREWLLGVRWCSPRRWETDGETARRLLVG
jgi:hypothetical protein